ncbi:MAG: UDP-4-amino-4,6-dideoxy-N-acetyl-beta-L-altrosamine N-acetyltransferase [Caulobacterales bacterium]|nr:UDP-4-amino-4,6-dideoxy-N-acetyl-beta-L-altrosamine N-acetyltransferase [Caulobacterales bacterium]
MSAPTITLRDVTAEDSARLLAWRNMPEVSAWMYSDHLISPDEHARWFESALANPARRYWIIEMDGLPVGLANLADIDLVHRKCAWAYYLADPAVRGRGVGSFVEFWMIEHVFADLRLNKLWCEVLIGNEPVWKLHESYGFLREALFRAHVWKDGEPMDVVGLGLLAADWAARRADRLARLKDKGFDVGAWA